MSTSIKISERSKSRLEELQAEIKLKTGRKVTQQELLDRLVDRSYESRDEFIETFRDDFDGLSEDEIDAWMAGTSTVADPVDEDEIDEVLYDDEHLR